MPPSCRDLTSIKLRFSPIITSHPFPRFESGRCIQPVISSTSAPCWQGMGIRGSHCLYLCLWGTDRDIPHGSLLWICLAHSPLVSSLVLLDPDPYSSQKAEKSGSDILSTIQDLRTFKVLALKFQQLDLLPSTDSILKLSLFVVSKSKESGIRSVLSSILSLRQ